MSENTVPSTGVTAQPAAPEPSAPLPAGTPQRTTRVRTLRWIRILVRAGLTWVAILEVRAALANTANHVLHKGISGWVAPSWAWQVAALVVGLAVGVHAYRTIGDLKPRPLGPPRSSPIADRADEQAVGYVARLAFGMLIVSLGLTGTAATAAASLVGASGRVADNVVIWVPAIIALVASVRTVDLAKAEYHEILMRQVPHRSLPNDLPQRAKAAQQAMQQAAFLAEELQEDVKVQQGVLDEIRRQVTDYQRTAAISRAEAESVAQVLEARQERARRRSFWSGLAVNVAVGFVFYLLGVLTPALVNGDSLREVLRQWLHLG